MLADFLSGFAALIAYFVVFLMLALVVRKLVSIPKEVSRKILHFMLLGSLPVFLFGFKHWWKAVLASLLFLAVVFPLLAFGERFKGYSNWLIERRQGEVKNSAAVIFVVFAVIITICWGWLGEPWLALASVYAWGFGDAAAALVGKKYGRRLLRGRTIEGPKTVEGTVAMFVVSFLTVGIIVATNATLIPIGYLLIPLVTAAVSAAVELYTPKGFDTLTCPLAATAVILPLVQVLGA